MKHAIRVVGVMLALVLLASHRPAAQTPDVQELTAPVNDFANIIDASSRAELERVIRALQAASGDVIVVATVPTIAPYGDIRDYAVKMFGNRGRGIGDRDKDNGLLVLVAPTERRVWVEVGYGLEGWITDGYAGQLSRDYFTPAFREGQYGTGLVAGVTQIAARIAQGRNVSLTGVEVPAARSTGGSGSSFSGLLFVIIVILALTWANRRPRRRFGPWGGASWSGWSSGVGPVGGGPWIGRGGGGGFGGGGGGFGGGFGGFGGGGSGGGGGGSSW